MSQLNPVENVWQFTRVIADRLISFLVRSTFGQMVFATDKLKEEGFRPRFGLEHLYREAIGRIWATQE
jgi:hypothetical protein